MDYFKYLDMCAGGGGVLTSYLSSHYGQENTIEKLNCWAVRYHSCKLKSYSKWAHLEQSSVSEDLGSWSVRGKLPRRLELLVPVYRLTKDHLIRDSTQT